MRVICSQVKLDTTANPVILQCKLIFKRTLALAFEQNLMRFAPNPSRDLGFEQFCALLAAATLQ